MAIPVLSDSLVEQLARSVADLHTHRTWTTIFEELALDAPPHGEGPRWQRIATALQERQRRDRCGNYVGALLQEALAPVRFVDAPAAHEMALESVNRILAFHGMLIGNDGRMVRTAPARTLSEADERAGRLRAELARRGVHATVLKFCRSELLQRNYFHAVLEATKSVAAEIRSRSGLQDDGAELARRAFGGQAPLLAINTLASETERSEQRGFVNLIVGVFGLFRNPTAHAPRIEWAMSEEEALDLLTMVSYLHRRLDRAARTHHPL